MKGFLLGAGFSKALHSSMPVMNDIVCQLELPENRTVTHQK